MDSARSKTILLAEDEELVRQLLLSILEKEGYHVIAATDGFDAVGKAEAHNGKIDLLVSDIIMPKLNGIELAQQLHLKRPDMKILLVSAFVPDPAALDYRYAFLAKPFTPEKLTQTVTVILGDAQDAGVG